MSKVRQIIKEMGFTSRKLIKKIDNKRIGKQRNGIKREPHC